MGYNYTGVKYKCDCMECDHTGNNYEGIIIMKYSRNVDNGVILIKKHIGEKGSSFQQIATLTDNEISALHTLTGTHKDEHVLNRELMEEVNIACKELNL